MADPKVGAPAPGIALLDRLGARARRRAEPRATIAVAGAGCALATLGAVVVGVSGGTGDGGFDRWPGVASTLLLLVAGVLVQHQVRRGPLTTAATVAIVLSLPPLLVFLTFDEGGGLSGGAPWSTEAVLVLSTLGWALAYLVGPGRGRPAFLAAAALGVWASTLQLVEKVFDLPFLLLQGFPFGLVTFGTDPYYDDGSYEEGFGYGVPDLPSPVTVGVLSLLIGGAFLLASRRLDQRGYLGAGTPLVVAAVPALLTGVNFLGADLGSVGAALTYVVLGLVLAAHGATAGRRLTCWLGAAVAAGGILNLAVESAETATTVGIAFLCFGLGTVVLAQVVSDTVGEPDEMALTAPSARRRGLPRRAVRPPSHPAD
jgi:hypothetical protein